MADQKMPLQDVSIKSINANLDVSLRTAMLKNILFEIHEYNRKYQKMLDDGFFKYPETDIKNLVLQCERILNALNLNKDVSKRQDGDTSVLPKELVGPVALQIKHPETLKVRIIVSLDKKDRNDNKEGML